MSVDLKNYFKREVFFKDIEDKTVQFKQTEQGKYQNALVKLLMREVITIIYVEEGQVCEKTFTSEEALKYFNCTTYNNKYCDITYLTTLQPGDSFYIDCPKYKGNAIFTKMSSESAFFIGYDTTKNESTGSYFDINDLLNGKATGEVWVRT